MKVSCRSFAVLGGALLFVCHCAAAQVRGAAWESPLTPADSITHNRKMIHKAGFDVCPSHLFATDDFFRGTNAAQQPLRSALSLHLSPVGFPLPAGRSPASPRRGGRPVPNVPNGWSGFLFCTRSGQQSVAKNGVLSLCECGLCTKCTKSTKCTKFSVCTKTGRFHNSFTFGALLWTFSWKRLTLMTLMTLFPHSTINNVYSLFICAPTQTPHHDFIMTKMTLL